MENKKKINLTPIVIVLLVISLIGNGALFMMYRAKVSEHEDFSQQKYTEEYFHYTSITVETFEEMVAEGEDFVVIVSRPNCGSCEELYEEVMQITEELDINDDVYFLNVFYHRQDEEGWASFKETYGFTGTPNYARFTNGEMASMAEWNTDHDENVAGIKSWLEAQNDLWD